MTVSISKYDIKDADFVDAVELKSHGTTVFLSGVTVVSTTSATKTVVLSGIHILYVPEEEIEVDDIVVLSGTSGGGAADGTYTVASIVDDTSFTVVESIADSTGGSADFKYPSGSLSVGVDTTGFYGSDKDTLQEALKEVDAKSEDNIAVRHKALRHLIHFIDSGPCDGFLSGAYLEQLPTADPFPTSATWYESSSKLKMIVEFTVTYNANKTPNVETWKMYDTDGITVLVTVTDTISYSSNVFETSRTRTIT
jgi:hypothetical protein